MSVLKTGIEADPTLVRRQDKVLPWFCNLQVAQPNEGVEQIVP